MNEDRKYHLYDRAFSMGGYGLADYLSDFYDDDKITGTRNGLVYKEMYHYHSWVEIRVPWHKYRERVSDIFDPLLEAWEGKFELDEEAFMRVLVYKVSLDIGLFDKLPGEPTEPEMYNEFSFFWV